MEIIKDRVRQEGPAGATARQVLAAVLDHTLRLFHPVIPFITEALWARLGEVVSERSFSDGSKLLVVSDWPKVQRQWKDPSAQQAMDLLQDLIRAVRDSHSHHGVPPGKKVALVVVADGLQREIIQANSQMICRLAHVSQVQVDPQAEKPPEAASVIGGSVQAFIPGIVDTAKELARLRKQQEQLLDRIASAQKKLADSQFLSRAKPQIVQRERESLKANETQLTAVNQQIEQTKLSGA